MPKENKSKVQPKKALGQHFLHDQHTARRIVNSLVIPDGVAFPLLEIGPGMGVLTRLLNESGKAELTVIEIDRESVTQEWADGDLLLLFPFDLCWPFVPRSRCTSLVVLPDNSVATRSRWC